VLRDEAAFTPEQQIVIDELEDQMDRIFVALVTDLDQIRDTVDRIRRDLDRWANVSKLKVISGGKRAAT
jgi:hypothetical protein